MNISFNNNQCVKINNEDEYDQVCHVFRNPRTYKEYSDTYGSLPFPIYLEHANSVYSGTTIGWTSRPTSTWGGTPLEVLSIEEATIN